MKEATTELLAKARRTLEAAERDLAAGDADNAVARAYYAAFHAATAALHEEGYRAKSHAGTQRLFFEHFVQMGQLDASQSGLFSSLYQMRQEADYAYGTAFGLERAGEVVATAAQFVDVVEGMVQGT